MTQTTSRRIVGVFLWIILFCVIGTVLGVIVNVGVGVLKALLECAVYSHNVLDYISWLIQGSYNSPDSLHWYAIYSCRCGSIIGCIMGLVSGVGAVKIATQDMKKGALLLLVVGAVSGVMIEVGLARGVYDDLYLTTSRYLIESILPPIVAGVLLGFAVGTVSLALLKKTRFAWSILGVPDPAGTNRKRPAPDTMPETQGNREMQAMGQQPPQAMGGPPVVVVQNVRFDSYPVQITCPSCSQLVQSRVEYVVGTATWLIGCFICVCAFCIDACKDKVHVCPSCSYMLGRKNLI